MSEFAPFTPEHQEAALPAPEVIKTLPTAEQAEPLRPGEADPMQKIEAARNAAEVEQSKVEQDDPLARLQKAEQAAEPAQPTFVNTALKKVTLQRELQAIRRKLPASQRALSRVVHQPVVRALSEVTGKTASRPSGLLGGGIVAFLGSSAYLYLTKHIGFTYNYFVFILLFVGGFALGLALELIVWSLTSRRQAK